MARNLMSGRLLLPVLVLAVLLGCATAPVQEMSDARQAIAAAEQAGAGELALDALAAARQYLTDAERSLQSRSYGMARAHALSAKHKAVEALAAAQGSNAAP